MSAVGNFFRLYGRNLRQIPRIPTVVVFGIAMPVIQLLLLGSVFSVTIEMPGHPYAGESYYMFIAPAIILLTAVLGMANSSAAFIVDLRTGYFDKLRTTPASPAAIIFARLLAEMTRVTAQCTLVLLLALALGARVATGFIGAVALLLVATTFALMTTGLMVMVLAMRTKSDQATQSAFPLFFLLLFLSTAFMPKPLLPGWLQTVVTYNPVDYVITAMRHLMFDGWAQAWPPLAVGLAAGAGIALLLAGANMRAFRRLVG